MHVYIFIYQFIFIFLKQVDCHYCTVLALSFLLERNSIKSSIVISITDALYFSMWNNTKRWSMYTMLSIEATVYADSNHKYSSIFKILKDKINWDYHQYLNTVLSIYRCLEFGTRGWLSTYKVSCPVTDSVRRGQRVSHVCIESKSLVPLGRQCGVRRRQFRNRIGMDSLQRLNQEWHMLVC